MVKVKCGAIIKEISNGAVKWYKLAGWNILEDKKKVKKDDKTNS